MTNGNYLHELNQNLGYFLSEKLARTLLTIADRPLGSDLFQSKMRDGGSAVADTGGARVEGAMIDTAWRRGTASRSRSLFFARRRRLVRLQGASRGFWAKCSVQDVAPVTPIRHLRPANAGVCTSRQSAICGRRTPESVLRAEATAHREAEK